MDKLYTVLVVDDEALLRKAMVEKLRGEGFGVVEAEDGLKGVELALTVHPELVLLDVEMPGLTGTEVIKKIREDGEWGKSVAVIFLTSFDTSEAMIEAITKYHPSFYLRKDEMTADSIVAKIRESLKIM